MSTTSSIKQLQTLKGVFDLPKMNHARDFLRENKVSLRDLQRVNEKNKEIQLKEKQRLMRLLPAQQQAQIQQAEQQQQVQQQTQKRDNRMSRRSSSQQRFPAATPQQQRVPAATSQQQQAKQLPKSTDRFNPQHPKDSTEEKYKNNRKGLNDRNNTNEHRDPITGKSMNNRNGYRQSSASRYAPCADTGKHGLASQVSIGTAGSIISHTDSCDKEIQTEDIHDEKFLYDALQKCSSGDMQNSFAYNNGLQSNNELAMPDRSGRYRQTSYYNEDQMLPQQQKNNFNYEDNMSTTSKATIMNRRQCDDNMSQCSKATVVSRRPCEMRAISEAQLNNNFENIGLENQDESDDEPMLQNGEQSARSRRTVVSTQTHDSRISLAKKRSTGSVHQLGSRDDVRLPRYLEREKREKAEQREREMEQDPNCPIGHFLLSEDERFSMLTMKEKKFQTLINELNHMPMTTQTLRIRTRKAEIEKELTGLEHDIHIFSKAKVYLKEQPKI